MPKPTLEEFLNDPAHKEKRDFLAGVIDARLKDILEQRKKQRKKGGDGEGSSGDSNVFDEIFGGDDDE